MTSLPTLRDDPGNPRWLRKALREIPREISRQVESFDLDALTAKPERGVDTDWSAAEILGYLAESEREDLANVEAMVEADGARIEERRAHLAPGEHDYAAEPPYRMLDLFLERREHLLWTLEFVNNEWHHTGAHPYRGTLTLLKYVREVSDRDLEASFWLRQLRDATEPVGARRRER